MRLRRTSKRMKNCSANIPVCAVKQGCLTYFVRGEDDEPNSPDGCRSKERYLLRQ